VKWNFECPSCGAKYLKTQIEDQAENRERSATWAAEGRPGRYCHA
jgi:hypothetical protein